MSTFLEANNLIIKVSFLLLVVFIFTLLMNVFTVLSSYIFSYDSSPFLIKGMKPANKKKVITQHPQFEDSVTIIRSKDESQGIEFSWSIWININDIKDNNGKHKHIFHKGNTSQEHTDEDKKGIFYPNNAPGVYLKPNSNTLVVIMNTFKNITEEIQIEDIPMNKWVNIIVRVEGQYVDVYINGMVRSRKILNDVPKQNYDDVYINMNGGFSGYVSDLKYFDHSVSIREINSIMRKGPNLTSENDDYLQETNPPYLSIKWFLS